MTDRLSVEPTGALQDHTFHLPRCWYVPVAAAAIALALTACSTAVYLKHEKTGEMVQCGPFLYTAGQAAASALREAQCTEDYKQQGYRRVPTP